VQEWHDDNNLVVISSSRLQLVEAIDHSAICQSNEIASDAPLSNGVSR